MIEQISIISVLILCVILVVALLGARLIKIERRLAKLSSVDAKLDLLLKHSGLEYDPYESKQAWYHVPP